MDVHIDACGRVELILHKNNICWSPKKEVLLRGGGVHGSAPRLIRYMAAASSVCRQMRRVK